MQPNDLLARAFAEAQPKQLPAPRYAIDPPPEPDEPAIAIAPWQPFPLDAMPAALGDFIRETAAALGCDPAMIALPALSVVAACIGTTRTVQLKPSWSEPAIIWSCVIARSGTLKSPAMDAALEPLRRVQHEAMELYRRERDEYERAKARGDAGVTPPVCTRHVASDTTVEALAPILAANPHGVLLARDELAGWLRSFNQYKSRGRGGDEASWLESHRGGAWCVDRKSQDGPTYVARAAVSVAGTIQPGVLAAALGEQHWESGLAARLLMAQPPERRKRWSDRAPPAHVRAGYESLVRELLTLGPDADGDPVALPLNRDALSTWRAWYDQFAERQAAAGDDREAASLAKLEAYAARFGLIFQLCENPDATAVGMDSIRRGTQLADWFADEQSRIYGLMGGDAVDRERARLVDWIRQRGGGATVRDLVRGVWRFRAKPDEAKAALDELARGGYGRWTNPTPDATGGRPRARFELHQRIDIDKTPRGVGENEGFVDVEDVEKAEPAADARPEGREDRQSGDRPPLHLLDDEAAAGERGETPEPW